MAGIPPLPQRSDSLNEPSTPPVPPIPKSTRGDKFVPDSSVSADNYSTDMNISDIKSTKGQLPDDSLSILDLEIKNHFENSFGTFQDFYDTGHLCDIEVKVGQKTFRCHRIILACISQYFQAMFKSEMTESKQNIVTIHDIDESAMEKLIKFAYTAKIQLTVDNVQPLLYAASILQIETVAKACCEFMKSHLHPTNCIGVHNFAVQHNRTELIQMAENYMLASFLDVKETEEFKSVNFGLLKTLVSSLDLNVNNEMEVYEAVMKWIQYDVEQRKVYLAEIISKVKLPLLSPSYLQQHVASNNLIRKDIECRDYLDEAKFYQMSLASLVQSANISERTRARKSYAGVLFCVGGRGSSGDPFKSVECYDPRKDKWFQVTEMTTRRRHVGVCCSGGMLYAIGGHDGNKHMNSGEMFDPITNKWKSISSMATPRRGLSVAFLGGAVYSVGGLDDTTCYNTVERYDPGSDTWTFVASMNIPRGGVGVASLKGNLYAVGGNDGVSSLEKCEKYDPFINKWTHVASMNRHRAGAAVSVLDGYIYVVGGFDDNSPLDSCERYDTELDEWTNVSSMSCCRGGVGLATLGGKLYAVGGHDGTSYLNSVEAYDPLNDRWNEISSIEISRAGAGVKCMECNAEMLYDINQYCTLNQGPAGKL